MGWLTIARGGWIPAVTRVSQEALYGCLHKTYEVTSPKSVSSAVEVCGCLYCHRPGYRSFHSTGELCEDRKGISYQTGYASDSVWLWRGRKDDHWLHAGCWGDRAKSCRMGIATCVGTEEIWYLEVLIDFRAVNNATVKGAYPLPFIEECIDSLVGKKWFCTLDMNSGIGKYQWPRRTKRKLHSWLVMVCTSSPEGLSGCLTALLRSRGLCTSCWMGWSGKVSLCIWMTSTWWVPQWRKHWIIWR